MLEKKPPTVLDNLPDFVIQEGKLYLRIIMQAENSIDFITFWQEVSLPSIWKHKIISVGYTLDTPSDLNETPINISYRQTNE